MTVLTGNNGAQEGGDRLDFDFEEALARDFEQALSEDVNKGVACKTELQETEADLIFAELEALFKPNRAEMDMRAQLEKFQPKELEELYAHTKAVLAELENIRLMHSISESLILERRMLGRITPERQGMVTERMVEVMETCTQGLKDARAAGRTTEPLVFRFAFPDMTMDELQAGIDGNDLEAFFREDFGVSTLTLTEEEPGWKVLTLTWPKTPADE